MKTKSNFLLTALAVVTLTGFVLIACKKNTNSTPPPPPASLAKKGLPEAIQGKKLKHVSQKMLDLNSKESVSLIKKFKANSKSQNQAARLVDIDSLTLDSATWVLETVLNFDFDYNSESSYRTSFATYSSTISINDGSLKLNSNELETIYEAFGTAVSEMINDSNKVKMIDVESYVYDPGTGTGIFVFRVQSLNSAHPITCHLPSGYISGTPSCILPASSTYYFNHFGCSPSGNFYNALDLLNISLDCYINNNTGYESTCGRWFWYSITQGVTYYPDYFTHSNPNPNELFYSGLQSLGYFCPSICITSTQLDNFYSAAISFGNATAPGGYVIASISYGPTGTAHISGSQGQLGWELSIQHGLRKCVSEMPD